MRKLNHIPFLFLLVASLLSCTPEKYDLIVYGGTCSGVMAAYSAAEEGLKVLVVEPTSRVGALTSGGLGQTDIGNKQVVKGLSLEFYRKLGAHYGNLENWIFEPSAALDVFEEYLDHKRITLIKGYHLVGASKEGTRITGVRVASQADTLDFEAPWFIDCSYEGDLMAAAGVEYRVGREDNSEYGETWDGVQMLEGHQFPDGVDPYVVPGDPSSGLVWGVSDNTLAEKGSGDNLVQAYNFRICLTDSLENMLPLPKPENYDPARYELLARLYAAQPEKTLLKDYFIWSPMPCRKTDINNRGGFSTDMIGMNHSYPEASWEERQAKIQAHKDYTLGLLWFTAHDPRVPESIRAEIARWGLAKDEFVDTDNWTPHLYIRESRRMVGEYVATQADCEGRAVVPDGIAMAAYTMDSHNCQRIVVHKNGKAMVKNEGNVEIGGGLPYPISYRSITPKREQCTNLLVTICCSASHIAYGSIRMEPVYMVMGQAAGLAVALARRNGLSQVQDVDYRDIVKVIYDSPDVVIDDVDMGDVPGWERRPVYCSYGRSALICSDPAAPAVFSAEIPASGTYDVYSYQFKPVEWLNPHTILELSTGQFFDFDASEVQVSGQTLSAWHYLTTVRLRAGQKFSATFRSDGGPSQTIADAVQLVRK